MQILSTPENFRGAFTDLIYTVSGVAPGQVVDVVVTSAQENDILGIKRFCGAQEFTVNISNYMRRQIEIEPYLGAGCAAQSLALRTAVGKIKIGSIVSPSRTFTGGIKSGYELFLLSDRPAITRIARDERDEVATIVPQGLQVTFRGVGLFADGVSRQLFSNTLTGANRVVAQIVDTSAFDTTGLRYIEVYLDKVVSGQSFLMHKYEYVGERADTMRLCWVNPHGAIDSYTFALCGSEKFVAEKSRVYTEDGYKIHDTAAQRRFALRSDYENRRTMEWLAQIIASPKMWICGQNRMFTPVDVITSAASIDRINPSQLTIEVRENIKTRYQGQ